MTSFIYPTVKRVTSDFRGNRKNHHGVDFAEKGYHEIKASASGTVSRSYYSESYGECVMIVHNIDGIVYETVYAHMVKGSRKVYEGQTVKQGQVIGVMGNTGDSNGQHLHFELHKGRWNINKSKAVNPLDYLEKSLKSFSKMVDEILLGKHGNGHTNRRKSLGISVTDYENVKNEVNKRFSKKEEKSINRMANEIIYGLHGNGHVRRRDSLGIDNRTYELVKEEVKRLLK